ncbi:MAG TPA: NusG domain II-containing protein [bacterium]|nr:NusG domain II-containing protein [bacterium]HOL47048.1 NusG domain II-containing protein [bacterium]HPQ17947.1 NusG domain II-containing protein [bacterium]
MKKYDIIFFLVLFIFYVFFFLKPQKFKYSKRYVKIVSPETTQILKLSEDQILTIKGKIGISKIKISNRSVEMLESPCPNKLCIKTGKIYKENQIIICAPNGIFITIENEDKDKNLDAITK